MAGNTLNNVVPPRKSRRSLFPTSNAVISEEHIANVFRAHAPAIDKYGNASHLSLPKIAKVTKVQRDRALQLWREHAYVPPPYMYMKMYHKGVDPDQVWIDLCKNDAVAIQHCHSFLQIYVEMSVRVRVVLGSEEEVEERAVKSCASLNTFWKSLIAAADTEVLISKRKDRGNHWMVLKRPQGHGAVDEGPVAQISHWIYHEGAAIMGLSNEPDYKTVEFTAFDIGLILKTLWLRADDIPFTEPIGRVIFHGLVLLFAFGPRRGMIFGMLFRDTTLAVVRDPAERHKRRLVATYTIRRNKLKRNALNHKKGTTFQFSTTLLPYALLCLTHIIAVIGVHFNAFKAGYKSTDDLLNRPIFEGVDYVELEWKEEFLDREILPMSYTVFLRRLRRVLLVAGFAVMARPYAFRVGALVEYDGSLTEALRNFVASHTTDVFENNYQTKHVRESLAHHRFGVLGGGASSEPLFNLLRDLSLQSDPGAPIEVAPALECTIEGRRDMTLRKKELEAAEKSGSKNDILRARASLQSRRQRLYQLLLMEAREKYFVQANNIRAQGHSTSHLQTLSTDGRRAHDSLDIAGLMELWTGQAGFGNRMASSEALVFDEQAEKSSAKAMQWLLHYSNRAWALLSGVKVALDKNNVEKQAKKIAAPKKSVCLLCGKTYEQRSSLTRHNNKHHIRAGSFNHPLPCPECQRQGNLNPELISGAYAWSKPVERVHDKRHAPRVRDSNQPTCEARSAAGTKRKRVAAPSIPGCSSFDSKKDTNAAESVPKKPRVHALDEDPEVGGITVLSEMESLGIVRDVQGNRDDVDTCPSPSLESCGAMPESPLSYFSGSVPIDPALLDYDCQGNGAAMYGETSRYFDGIDAHSVGTADYHCLTDDVGELAVSSATVNSPISPPAITAPAGGSVAMTHVHESDDTEAIDAERGIYEVEALLAKWKSGRKILYLVKWRGFPDSENTWEPRRKISGFLVQDFEATYRGNHQGVRLIEERQTNGGMEYFVEWRGRPTTENSWEKESTISRERIEEFETARDELEI